MSATSDSGYQYTKIGADAEQAARRAAEDNLPVDMMNDRRMRSYAGLWAIIGAKAAATVVLAEARVQSEQDIADAEKCGAVKALRGFAAGFALDNDPTSRVLAGRVANDLMDRAHLIENGEVDFDGLRVQTGGDR